MTRSEFAAHVGVTKPAVTAWAKAGRLVMEGNLVRAAASIDRINATAAPDKAHVAARHAEARGHALLTAAAAATTTAPPAGNPPSLPAGAAGDDDEPAGIDYQAARAKREHYLAKAAERDYLVSIGQLLRADDVTGALAAVMTSVRARLEAMPDLLAPQVIGVDDEPRVRALLAEHVELALAEAARELATMGVRA
jgi:hypothetical protein